MAEPLISRDPGVPGGTSVFSGAKVPNRILFEYLEAGDRSADFLRGFPAVTEFQAVRLLERASRSLSRSSDEAAA